MNHTALRTSLKAAATLLAVVASSASRVLSTCSATRLAFRSSEAGLVKVSLRKVEQKDDEPWWKKELEKNSTDSANTSGVCGAATANKRRGAAVDAAADEELVVKCPTGEPLTVCSGDTVKEAIERFEARSSDSGPPQTCKIFVVQV